MPAQNLTRKVSSQSNNDQRQSDENTLFLLKGVNGKEYCYACCVQADHGSLVFLGQYEQHFPTGVLTSLIGLSINYVTDQPGKQP